jgi:hypothetical protein
VLRGVEVLLPVDPPQDALKIGHVQDEVSRIPTPSP